MAPGCLWRPNILPLIRTECKLTAGRVIHREDYHRILFDEAIRLGAEIRLDTDVADVDTGNSKVFLKKGEVITGDAIIGADGMF